MPRMEIERTVAAPPEEVFAAAADFAGSAETIEGIDEVEMLTDGAVGVGTRFRETRRIFGREATEEMEVTAFEPPRSYSLFAESHGTRYLSTFTFEEVPEGTSVQLVFDARPQTLTARILAFLTAPMHKKVIAMLAKDLEDLKAAIEARRA